MKKTLPIFVLLMFLFVLSGCDNSVARANNAIGRIQDNTQKLVNDLYEIQTLENNLQGHFESDLAAAGNDLSYFNRQDILVMQNIEKRESFLKKMQTELKELMDLLPEMQKAANHQQLPGQSIQTIATMITYLNDDLTVYIDQYLENIALEKETFQSIGNPNVDFNTFFKVFDNINILTEENFYYLDRVLRHFEPLNALLVDTKVQIVTILESK